MPRGRPKKEIDKRDFESLLTIQCTLDEVVAFFDNKLDGCSESTIERWCKRTYKSNFEDIAAKKRKLGKISLRRAQFKLAKKNASMAIWLGKVILEQRETVAVINNVDDDSAKALDEYLEQRGAMTS